ncbi:MAG: MgtC/SapB family protein [archaeon]
MDFGIILLKMGLIFVLAFLFGLERQRSHKPVGFGTFTFVSIGACALAIVADSLGIDRYVPLLAAIVTGIGFLGAGALIRTNDKLFGATTAAGIWLFAIIGLVVGVGEYALAAFVYVLAWLVILIDNWLQTKGVGLYQKHVRIITNRIITEKEIRKHIYFGSRKHKLVSIEIDKTNNRMKLSYVIEGNKENINAITNQLFEQEWLESYTVE